MAVANITAFLTSEGIDLVYRNEADVQFRTRIQFEYMRGRLAQQAVSVELTDSDDVLMLKFGDIKLELKQQPKGHYFSWLGALKKGDPIDISEMRRRVKLAQTEPPF